VTDNGVSLIAQAFNRHLAELGIAQVMIRYRPPRQLGKALSGRFPVMNAK